MTKASTEGEDGEDVLVDKFTKLIESVLDTELPKGDVKIIKQSESNTNTDDDADDEEPKANSEIILFVKITTK